jgi:hypothetical protein
MMMMMMNRAVYCSFQKQTEREEARKGLIKTNVVDQSELALVLQRHIAKAAGPGPYNEHRDVSSVTVTVAAAWALANCETGP